MYKIIFMLGMVATLSGCYALKPVAWVTDEVCEKRTETENALLAEKVDEATYPHTIRVQCYAQVKE